MMREPVIRRLVFHYLRGVWAQAGRRGLGSFRQISPGLDSFLQCFQRSAGSFRVRSVG
jgi:hypothetical protein